MKRIFTIAKVNLICPKIPILMTTVICSVQLLAIYIQYLVNANGIIDGANSVSIGNIAFLYLITVSAIVPWYNFARIMHLGGKKKDFFVGSYLTYVILAVILSILNTVIYLTIDKLFEMRIEIYNLIDVFKWTDGGVLFSTIRMFSFALLVSTFIHTLSALQTQKLGWIIDVVLIIIPSVFIPIPQLRELLVKVIQLFTFTDNGIFQIVLCIILSIAIYMGNFFVLRKKRI